MGSVEGQFDVLRRRLSDLGDRAGGCRTHVGAVIAARRLLPLAADEVLEAGSDRHDAAGLSGRDVFHGVLLLEEDVVVGVQHPGARDADSPSTQLGRR